MGKSSLLNRIAGEERAVVDNVAGTTVDPVDSLVEIDGEDWILVDTAGLRRRVARAAGTVRAAHRMGVHPTVRRWTSVEQAADAEATGADRDGQKDEVIAQQDTERAREGYFERE